MDNRETPIAKPFALMRSPRLVLAATLLVTLAVSYFSYRMVTGEVKLGFNQRAEQIKDVLQLGMQAYVNTLTQTKGFFVANDNRISRESFRDYVRGIDLLNAYPGLRGLGYAVRTSKAGLARQISDMRAAGFPDYRVWPDRLRSEYFPILFLEPLDWRNRRALGYDMFSEPVRRHAMEQARDTGLPVASGRVDLMQETGADRQPGFLIYVPVYRPGAPLATVAQRRAALVGFVYSPFRANDIFNELFGQDTQKHLEHIRFTIYDGIAPDPANLLYEHIGTAARSGIHRRRLFERIVNVDVAGHPWTVHVTMAPGEATLSTFMVPLLILGFGITVSLLLYRILRDMQARQLIEEQLLKVRNLESIGVLAGGIAHDFNNILTAILGNISLGKLYTQASDKVYEILTEAEKACWRARELTHQLLTFAKGGTPVKRAASIAEVVRDTATFALRGANVKCDLRFDDDIWPMEFDAGQISQVVANLVINAKQAMPEGGIVIIALENAEVTAGKIFELSPGRYIKLTVTDTGTGISPRYIDKIFDPYFTTKSEGSGLGLATTYSIVKKHGGYIGVNSRVGIGTTFTIYIPATGAKTNGDDFIALQAAPRAQGRILVMDDEEPVRAVALRLLNKLGYDVVTVPDATTLLREYRGALAAGHRFDAVVLDLTIPGGMGGAECLRELQRVDTDVCAVVSSGYSNTPIIADYERWGFAAIAPKPYRADVLHGALQSAIKKRKRKADGSNHDIDLHR